MQRGNYFKKAFLYGKSLLLEQGGWIGEGKPNRHGQLSCNTLLVFYYVSWLPNIYPLYNCFSHKVGELNIYPQFFWFPFSLSPIKLLLLKKKKSGKTWYSPQTPVSCHNISTRVVISNASLLFMSSLVHYWWSQQECVCLEESVLEWCDITRLLR